MTELKSSGSIKIFPQLFVCSFNSLHRFQIFIRLDFVLIRFLANCLNGGPISKLICGFISMKWFRWNYFSERSCRLPDIEPVGACRPRSSRPIWRHLNFKAFLIKFMNLQMPTTLVYPRWTLEIELKQLKSSTELHISNSTMESGAFNRQRGEGNKWSIEGILFIGYIRYNPLDTIHLLEVRGG